MATDRYILLGLATVRSAWTRDVTGWAMSGALPIDFVKCMSVEEMRARLRSGGVHSAVLCDARAPGVDRDLFALAEEFGTSTVVVGDSNREWTELGADAMLHEIFGREELLSTLEQAARPVRRGEQLERVDGPDDDTRPFDADLVAVTGRTGSGVSTTAIALAQGFGSSGRLGGLVLLADLALDADQAMLHDATDIVPGLQELVDAHRAGRPSRTQIRDMTFAVPHRRYDLLLGLRRHHDWVALRPRALDATLDGLRRSYRMVVADITADFEGEDTTGSIDVEERNAASRAVASCAAVVVAVGSAGLSGLHGLVRTIDSLLAVGVDIGAIQPVITRGPRLAKGRAELTRVVSDLVDADGRGDLAAPVILADRRHLDDAHRNGTALPASMCSQLTDAVRRRLDVAEHAGSRAREPIAVAPGSFGTIDDDI